MTPQEFFQLVVQTLVRGFESFLGGLAPVIQWVVYACASVPLVILAVLGWKFILKPAWNNALAQLAFGKGEWFWMLLRRLALTVIFVFLIFAAIWLAPRLGNGALVVAADGMAFTLAAPPLAGATHQPLFTLPNFQTPGPTAAAQPSVPSPTAQPGDANNGTYKVTLQDGAITRSPGANNACDDSDAQLGNLPFGTVVTIVGTWPSSNIPGLRGLTSTGVCVHLSALTKQ